MSRTKILPLPLLQKKVEDLRRAGKTIGTLNGSFDLLHAGHLHILQEASRVADVLIVAVNSDESVKAYKSPDRPIIPLLYRMEILAALECVHYVISFEETDPRALLACLKPDIHVNGEEYGLNCLEAEVVKQNGGKIHLVKRVPGLATSEIIKKIQKMENPCA